MSSADHIVACAACLDGGLVDVLIFIETNLSCAACAAIFSCSDPAEPHTKVKELLRPIVPVCW
jgi:hypothetical protein